MSSDTDAVPHPGFDAHHFWDEHKTKVLGAVALIVIAAIGYGFWQYHSQQRFVAAGAAFAAAEKSEDYHTVIDKYPGTVAAGNAHLLLAEELRKQKKFDETLQILHAFVDKYPEHPLVHAGLLSLGETMEAQGKFDEAINTYQQVASKYPDSYSAPLATLNQAGVLQSKGKPDEARRIYENFIAQFPDSIFSQEAMRRMQALKK